MSSKEENDLIPLVTLGGCVVNHLAESLSGKEVFFRGHYWRRPTLALMSEPVSRFRYDFSVLPGEFTNYFINDACGAHRDELFSGPDGGWILIDITRDLFTGVVEIEPDVWVMDPVDAVGIVDGLTPETMSADVLKTMLKKEARRLSPLDDWPDFYAKWQESFEEFINRCQSKFEKIVIAEIYLTDIRYDTSNVFWSHQVEPFNSRLQTMYAWVREKFDLDVLSIPREMLVTGVTGKPYSGPTPTHFIQETHEVLRTNFVKKINASMGNNQEKFNEVESFVEKAFERARLHEADLEKIKVLEGRISDLEHLISEAQAKDAVSEEAIALLHAEISNKQEELRSCHETIVTLANTRAQFEALQETSAVQDRKLAHLKLVVSEQSDQLAASAEKIKVLSKTPNTLRGHIRRSLAKHTVKVRRKFVNI